jgi:hypothetical protein
VLAAWRRYQLLRLRSWSWSRPVALRAYQQHLDLIPL